MDLVREDTHLVRTGASAKFLRVLFGRTFDEDGESLADITFIALQTQTVLEGNYFIQPSGLDLEADIVRVMPASTSVVIPQSGMAFLIAATLSRYHSLV